MYTPIPLETVIRREQAKERQKNIDQCARITVPIQAKLASPWDIGGAFASKTNLPSLNE